MPSPPVVYIPSEDDWKTEFLKDEAERRSPLRLCIEDCGLLIRNLFLCPYIALPLRHPRPLAGVPKRQSAQAFDYGVVFVLTLLQLPVLFLGPVVVVLLPGWVTILVSVATFAVFYALARLTWGSLVVESQVNLDKTKFPDEKWLFVNGVATGHSGLIRSCNYLAATFKRPITGIHNRSWGIVADMLECLIQRSFNYHTQDVRVAGAWIQRTLQDDSVKKVVIIAHSQGGIIISLALERLYTILPAHIFSKLEIYTFGSAAAHFHNPWIRIPSAGEHAPAIAKAKPSSNPSKAVIPLEISNHLIPTIEHYVNQWDLVPRWGVLYHVKKSAAGYYSGRVFVHQNTSGHLFDQHYLDRMFGLNDLPAILKNEPKCFLNHAATVDAPEHHLDGLLRARTMPHGQTDADMARLASNDLAAARDRVFTVRQLSRLWRYMDGGTVNAPPRVLL